MDLEQQVKQEDEAFVTLFLDTVKWVGITGLVMLSSTLFMWVVL